LKTGGVPPREFESLLPRQCSPARQSNFCFQCFFEFTTISLIFITCFVCFRPRIDYLLDHMIVKRSGDANSVVLVLLCPKTTDSDLSGTFVHEILSVCSAAHYEIKIKVKVNTYLVFVLPKFIIGQEFYLFVREMYIEFTF